MAAFLPLVESDPRDAPDRLRQRLGKSGYLFFPGLLPAGTVSGLRRDVLGVLSRWGLLDPGSPVEEGVCRPGEPPDRALLEQFHLEINRLESFEGLAHDRRLLRVMRGLLGENVLVHKRKICRVKYPDDPYDVVLPHQDFWYIKGDPGTISCWIPLMAMDEGLGGLAVAAGSHVQGPLPHVRPEVSRFSGVADATDRYEWRRSDYEPGDALLFLGLTVHQGLLNTTRRVRLSVDYRYQRADAPMDASHARPHFT
jgi:hypothetical protein